MLRGLAQNTFALHPDTRWRVLSQFARQSVLSSWPGMTNVLSGRYRQPEMATIAQRRRSRVCIQTPLFVLGSPFPIDTTHRKDHILICKILSQPIHVHNAAVVLAQRNVLNLLKWKMNLKLRHSGPAATFFLTLF